MATAESSQILWDSRTIFISSVLYPSGPIPESWLKRLKAYCWPKISQVGGRPANTSRVCCSSSAMAAAPAPLAA